MGSYFSNTVISEVTLDFVLLPLLDAVTHVISWFYSIVDVVDKCFDSMPGGAVGSSHGDLAEVEVLVNSSEASSESQQQAVKIRNTLKLVEMGAIRNSGVNSSEHSGDGKGDQVCAVCLGDIMEEEKVYELPECDHIFHSACLDRWVGHNHYTCPLCRTPLITGSHYVGPANIMQEDQGALAEEGPGFFLGMRLLSRYATNANLDSRGWAHSVMRLAGF